jgi:mannose/fructose/N-acetylgalactosamine-specific phosphotransferase system component IIB
MAISFVRVDDRVIHGQTITRWATQRPCDAILVISDKVANDELRKKVLKAASGHLKLGIYTVQQGVAACQKAAESKKNFFIISDSVEEFAALKKAGGDFGTTLNIGNLSGTRPGIKNLGGAVCINDEDVECLDYLADQGIDLQFQMIPDDGVRTWPQLKAKYQSM